MFEFIGTHNEYFLSLIIVSCIILIVLIGVCIKTKFKSVLSKIIITFLSVLLVLSLGIIYKARSAATNELAKAPYHTLTIKDIQSQKYKGDQYYYKLNTIELGPNITTTSLHKLKPNMKIAYKQVNDVNYINGNKIKDESMNKYIIQSKNIKNFKSILKNQKFIVDNEFKQNQFNLNIELYQNKNQIHKINLSQFYEIKNTDEINLIQSNNKKIKELNQSLDNILKDYKFDEFRIIVKKKG